MPFSIRIAVISLLQLEIKMISSAMSCSYMSGSYFKKDVDLNLNLPGRRGITRTFKSVFASSNQ